MNHQTKIFRTLTLRRSGSHGIIIWLMHQKQNMKLSYPIIGDLTKNPDEIYKLDYLYDDCNLAILFNGRDKKCNNLYTSTFNILAKKHNVNYAHIAIVGFEDVDIRDCRNYEIKNLDKCFNNFILCPTILIVRNFKNWLASIFKNSRSVEYLTKQSIQWKIYANEAIDQQLVDNKYIILFDKWFKSKAYREKICFDLDLDFTDTAINSMLYHGWGSSFDGLKYDGNASQMKVLDRWKNFENDELFNNLLNKFNDCIELSERIF